LGGIGEAVARFLVETVAARVILVGRSALPAREKGAADPKVRRLQHLEAVAARTGGAVMYVEGDVADRGRMEEVRELVRARWGAVHGVVHAAGLPGRGLIARQERAAAAAVLAPKIRGTLVLADLFPSRELDFCVLCSSLAATLGGLGQADYCAANAFQDAFAGTLAASGDGGRMISVAWDTWKDAGMAVDTNPALTLEGLDEAAGIEALRRILARVELPQVLVSVRDLDLLTAEAGRPRDLLSEDSLLAGLGPLPTPEERHARPQLAVAYVAPRTPAETKLAEIWQDLLGIAPVGVHDDFFELGGDSVLSLRIVARAREQGLLLTPGQVFQGPTIAALAALASDPEVTAPPAPEPSAGPPRKAGGAALTPEDVPDAEISARDLETLLSQLGGGSAV
jgi:aryl carrier-like protein